MEIIFRGTPEEIAALVLAVQERQRGALQVDVPKDETILSATDQE